MCYNIRYNFFNHFSVHRYYAYMRVPVMYRSVFFSDAYSSNGTQIGRYLKVTHVSKWSKYAIVSKIHSWMDVDHLMRFHIFFWKKINILEIIAVGTQKREGSNMCHPSKSSKWTLKNVFRKKFVYGSCSTLKLDPRKVISDFP